MKSHAHTQKSLRFGTGGVPLSTKPVTDKTGKKLDLRQSAIFRLVELGLNHMEVEFVHGVNISEENAYSLRDLAEKHDISLTVHGPYYINLASAEKPKYYASIHRVKKSLLAAHWIGATSLTFHPAFYQERSSEETTDLVKNALLDVLTDEKLQEKIGSDYPLLSLETTGKPTQWGSLEEITTLARELNDTLGKFCVSVCIDFAHLHARSNGANNTPVEFDTALNLVSATLGKEALQHLHIHLSGIQYSEKGEQKHLALSEADLRYKDILSSLKKYHVTGWLVCESPNLEEDAMMLKKKWLSL